VTSVFFGGGTPSLMTPATTGAILDAIAAAWEVDKDAEITLEGNPTSVEATRFRGYRAAGVNRVSLGVQALNDPDLRRLGRMHTAEEALAAVKVAAGTFERFSFDLIYARPEQTPEAWVAELREAIGHAAEHLSLYQLTIEPGTWFERLHEAGKLVIPDHEAARALYDVTQEICEAHRLPSYEISNHARPGAESRHNLVYWRYGEYAGIGPGAHGRLVTDEGRIATAAEKHPESWLARVEAHGHGIVESERLTPEEETDEFLLMGLRLREGIDPARYEALAGRALDERRIASLLGDGLIATRVGARLAVTPAGFPVLDAVVADLAA
jgi:oxygen-independent coproporphyrinogen-3 oxidase